MSIMRESKCRARSGDKFRKKPLFPHRPLLIRRVYHNQRKPVKQKKHGAKKGKQGKEQRIFLVFFFLVCLRKR